MAAEEEFGAGLLRLQEAVQRAKSARGSTDQFDLSALLQAVSEVLPAVFPSGWEQSYAEGTVAPGKFLWCVLETHCPAYDNLLANVRHVELCASLLDASSELPGQLENPPVLEIARLLSGTAGGDISQLKGEIQVVAAQKKSRGFTSRWYSHDKCRFEPLTILPCEGVREMGGILNSPEARSALFAVHAIDHLEHARAKEAGCERAAAIDAFFRVESMQLSSMELSEASRAYAAAEGAYLAAGGALESKLRDDKLTRFFLRYFAAHKETAAPEMSVIGGQHAVSATLPSVVDALQLQAVDSSVSSGKAGVKDEQSAALAHALAQIDRSKWVPRGGKAVGAEDAAFLSKKGGPVLLPLSLDEASLRALLPSLTPGANVLDTPCGTGYFSALCCSLVAPNGYVAAEDPDEAVAAAGLKCLETEYLHLFEGGLMKLHLGDGLHGYHGVRFDAIRVGARCSETAIARYASMLADGGRLVAFFGSHLLLVRRLQGDSFTSSVVRTGVSVPLRDCAPVDVWGMYRKRQAKKISLSSYPFGKYAYPVFEALNDAYPGVQVLSRSPPIYLVHDFLTPAQCDALIKIAEPGLVRSQTSSTANIKNNVTRSRTSSGMWLQNGPQVARIALKLRPLFLRQMQPESPQVTRYHEGEFYVPHMDAGDHMRPDQASVDVDNRKATVLTYLNDVPRGGHTTFPLLKVSVPPTRGAALIFFPSFADGYIDKRALHEAQPAIDEKWVMQLWLH